MNETKCDLRKKVIKIKKVEAGRGAVARGVTGKPIGCGFDPHSRR